MYLQEFVVATTLDDRTIEQYFFRIKMLIDALASVGDPGPSQQHIDVILEGLPQNFGPVVFVIIVVKIGIKVVKSMDFAILLTLKDLDPK
ncbi:DNA polymerase [Trifolium pratense]|uniref:DNA polymerase n=1 Tax=Trifolium pratense TaxID=57577 RepID=A0A2K3NVX8_TRIPR|nr:DNA polymerase [Trifolium pratense]